MGYASAYLCGGRRRMGMHQHKCSLCAMVWQHSHDSFENFRDHICPACGYLELMVDKPGAPPMSESETRKAAGHFLGVGNHADSSVRTAAAFSLGALAVESQRAVPMLAERVARDRHPGVRRACVEALGQFGV